MDNQADPSDAEVEAVCAALSPERMSTYLAYTGGDPQRAVELYRWNTEISAALYETLAITEVVFRNAINDQLVSWCRDQHGHDRWFQALTAPRYAKTGQQIDPLLRDERSREHVVRAVAECCEHRSLPAREVTAGMVTAQITFGFWTRLFHKDNSDVWPLIHKALPHHPDGYHINLRKLHRPLSQLIRIRNRIAHHEPLLREHLDKHRQAAIDLVGWICPDTKRWLERHCRVATLLAARPTDGNRNSQSAP